MKNRPRLKNGIVLYQQLKWKMMKWNMKINQIGFQKEFGQQSEGEIGYCRCCPKFRAPVM